MIYKWQIFMDFLWPFVVDPRSWCSTWMCIPASKVSATFELNPQLRITIPIGQEVWGGHTPRGPSQIQTAQVIHSGPGSFTSRGLVAPQKFDRVERKGTGLSAERKNSGLGQHCTPSSYSGPACNPTAIPGLFRNFRGVHFRVTSPRPQRLKPNRFAIGN